MINFGRFYIDRRDTEIRGLNVPRRIVRVLHGTDAFDTVSFRRERQDGTYGRTVRAPFAEFHKRFVIILPKSERTRANCDDRCHAVDGNAIHGAGCPNAALRTKKGGR